jgi:hypothetical protein
MKSILLSRNVQTVSKAHKIIRCQIAKDLAPCRGMYALYILHYFTGTAGIRQDPEQNFG